MRVESPKPYYDLIVVGGGMVGASFACALSRQLIDTQQKLSVLVVEAVDLEKASPAAASSAPTDLNQPSFDARSTALSYGSSRIFERMGLWQNLSEVVTPIKEIQISDKDRFGSVELNDSEMQLDALGYVVENRQLGSVLNQEMTQSTGIDFLVPATISAIHPTQQGMRLSIDGASGSHTLNTSLVVLADGGRSPICDQLGIRRSVEQYKQHALIANVSFEKPHNNIAFERFTDSGPLALLPLESFADQNRGSLVWTIAEQQSAELMAMDDDEMLQKLAERFGNRLGKMLHIGERVCYPLSLSVAQEQIRPGLVLLGNVAHNLHPVAGQGLNLALRDTEALVNTLAKAQREAKPLGDMSVLQSYLQQQEADQQRTITFTHYITRLFSSNAPGKVWLRKFGLFSIDLVPSIRREFAKQAMGIATKS